MKTILTGTGLAIAIAGAVSIFSAMPAYAQTTAQTTITPTTTPGSALTPEEVGNLPKNYGLVGSDFLGGTTLQVRTMDGATQSYKVSPEVASSLSLRRGELVGFDTDEQGMITSLRPPSVARQYQGTIQNIAYSEINGTNVGTITLELPDGSVETTQANATTITNSGLSQGDELVVTEFQGTYATKLCRPVAVAPPPIAPPPPVELPPPPTPEGGVIEPIPALW
jgi:hypothetical protein